MTTEFTQPSANAQRLLEKMKEKGSEYGIPGGAYSIGVEGDVEYVEKDKGGMKVRTKVPEHKIF